MISFRLLTRPTSMQFQKGIGVSGRKRWIYPTAKKLAWTRAIRAAAAQYKPEAPFNEPIAMGLTFIFKTPLKPSCVLPAHGYADLTNLTKGFEDCLTGLFYTDDSLIVKKHEQKLFGAEDCIECNIALLDEWRLFFGD